MSTDNQNAISRYGLWVVQHPWWVLLASLLLVITMASGARHLGFSNSYTVFFSEDNPQLQAFEALEKTYTKNDNIMFILAPDNGDIFTAQNLRIVQELTDKAWQTPYSIRVDSISNFQHIRAEGDDLLVEDLVPADARLEAGRLADIRTVALHEPRLVKRIVSESGHVSGVNVTIQLPGLNAATEVPEVVAFARSLAEEMRSTYPDMEIRLSGTQMMDNAFSEASMKDMQTLIPISFVLMLITLALMLRGFSATAATTVVIFGSIAAAMGGAGYIGYPISPPSSVAPIIILTLAIANAVHVLVTFLHGMRGGMNKQAAMVESLRINLGPVLLASATTALGFLSLNFSEVPPFNHLGNISAIGVVVSFVLAITLLPAMMMLLPVRVKVDIRKEGVEPMARLGEFVVRYRGRLMAGMAVLIIALVANVPRNELNDVFVHYFDTSVQFRADADFMEKNLSGLYIMDYSLESGESDGVKDPAFLNELEAFAQWYRLQPETTHVSTITDTLKSLNKSMHGDDPAWYKLPEEQNLAAQYLLLYELSLPYGLDLNNQLNVDKSSTRFTATLRTLSTNEVLALEQRAQRWLDDNTRHIHTAGGSGPTVMFAHIGQRNIMSMLTGTTVALIMISLVLILALRSFKVGLVSLIPNLVPAAMGFGLWGMLVGEVGLSLSIVAGMTLGIVVDDTVHFLSKYLRARREQGLNPQEAVVYSFRTVGFALFTTTVVLTAGFLVLSLSSFHLNSGMGMLTSIVLAFALLADFLFLPPLLMKIEEKKNAQVHTDAVTAAEPAASSANA